MIGKEKLNNVLERARLMRKHLRPIMIDIGEIEAINDAFLALEQENILLKQGCENNPLVHEMIDWRERAESAEHERDCHMDIAEHFKARCKELEQRAEAAEAERSALQDGFAEAIRHKDRLADELNELAKQEPAGHFMLARDEDDSWWHEASEQNDKAIPLYTRPAPAADLADLVPDAKAIRKEAGGYAPVYSLQEQQLFIDGATWLRAAILLNIEEMSK